jgi:hypothetical protein
VYSVSCTKAVFKGINIRGGGQNFINFCNMLSLKKLFFRFLCKQTVTRSQKLTVPRPLECHCAEEDCSAPSWLAEEGVGSVCAKFVCMTHDSSGQSVNRLPFYFRCFSSPTFFRNLVSLKKTLFFV